MLKIHLKFKQNGTKNKKEIHYAMFSKTLFLKTVQNSAQN